MPALSGFVPTHSGADYRQAKVGTLKVLASNAVMKSIAATYDRILIDEYQDCSTLQHDLAVRLGTACPIIAFGDPMQYVFDFNKDRTPSWATVWAAFEDKWSLNTPWRWNNVGEDQFGKWVLRQRENLLARKQIDFNAVPSSVKWLPLPPDSGLHHRFNLDAGPKPTSGTTLFVLNDRQDTQGRRKFARDGIRLSVVENADLPDLMLWCHRLERATGQARIELLLRLAHDVMTEVNIGAILDKLGELQRSGDNSVGSDEERKLLRVAAGEVALFGIALEAMSRARNVHRPELMEAFCQAARLASKETDRSLSEAGAIVRDKRASGGRKLGARAVGSTLLLKGMEADHAVIIDADQMKATDLYVAISRACRSLTVISKSPNLPAR